MDRFRGALFSASVPGGPYGFGDVPQDPGRVACCDAKGGFWLAKMW